LRISSRIPLRWHRDVSGPNRTIWRLSTLVADARLVIAKVVIVLAVLELAFAHNRLDGVAFSLQVISIACALAGVRISMRHTLRKCHESAEQCQSLKVPLEVERASDIKSELLAQWTKLDVP
jgi:hypothetical protein